MTPALILGLTLFSSATPPERYRGETVAVVETFKREEIGGECERQVRRKPPKGMVYRACTRREDRVYLPNPCDFPDEVFAHLACHELGHWQGWSRWHED